MQHTNVQQFPREVQDWQRDAYTETLFWHAFNTFGLSGEEASEYVRIEKELDRISETPSMMESHQDRYNALMRRHAWLTQPRRPLSNAA